jgi:hypothetical protein
MKIKMLSLLATAGTVVILAGCGDGGKTYDISAIFPLSPDKCAEYGGTEEGSGPGATCMVTKEQCERAVSDWRAATQNVSGAINFRCD